MVNTNKIKDLIKSKGKTQRDCANAIGVKTPTFNQKLHGIRHFRLDEAERLQKFLGVPDLQFAEYFFC